MSEERLTRQEAFEKKEWYMEQIYNWIMTPKEKRKPSNLAFTEGYERTICNRFEILEMDLTDFKAEVEKVLVRTLPTQTEEKLVSLWSKGAWRGRYDAVNDIAKKLNLNLTEKPCPPAGRGGTKVPHARPARREKGKRVGE